MLSLAREKMRAKQKEEGSEIEKLTVYNSASGAAARTLQR
jgi:hypothetical protein